MISRWHLREEDFRYVEEFDTTHKAGAAWGQQIPLFESIWLNQKQEGICQWGPFDGEEEWELAEWLIKNVGQKQTDTFLKLPIVRYIDKPACTRITEPF